MVGVDGFDEVVGDFGADGLVHDVLFFGLGDHDDGDVGLLLLDAGECFEAGEAGHVLVEDDEVEVVCGDEVEGVAAVVGGEDVVSFFAEEEEVGFEEVDFVVGPEDAVCVYIHN